MASFYESYILTQDKRFAGRVKAGIAKIALAWINDAGNHTQAELDWANEAILDVESKFSELIWRVAQNATLQSQAPNSMDDGSIEYVLITEAIPLVTG